MRNPKCKERLSYRFDQLMSKGTVALVALLFAVTVVVALLVAALACLFTPASAKCMGDTVWNSFMRILDAGNVMGDYETGEPLYVLFMIVAAVCGLFVTSILIGIINTAFQKKLESLRRGNSRVLEKGHTVILGYDEHLSTILGELISANENEKNAAVVILCEREKPALEEELAAQVGDFRNTRVICRCGDPTSFPALRNVSLLACARVIALGADDFTVIQEILAANTLLEDQNVPPDVTVSAVITQEQNLDAARIAGGARAEILYFEKVISRIFAQTCRKAGLSQVYQELFDFQGDEIYMEPADALVGVPFIQLSRYYCNASIMGLRREGRVLLNPPGETLVQPGDAVILIAADNGVAVPGAAPAPVDAALFRPQPEAASGPRSLLVLGQNPLTEDIIREISLYAAPDATLTVASASAAPGETRLRELAVRAVRCDVLNREALWALLAQEPDCVIVLAEDGQGDADARTLTVLLQLSHYYRDRPDAPVVVSEMRSKKNQALASVARVNDFVVGSNLASLVLTQIALNRSLNALFDELLTDEGNEIYIKPLRQFVDPAVPVDLYTLAAATAQTGQQLLGLRLQQPDGRFTVLLNPDKGRHFDFGPEDCVIVLAES